MRCRVGWSGDGMKYFYYRFTHTHNVFLLPSHPLTQRLQDLGHTLQGLQAQRRQLKSLVPSSSGSGGSSSSSSAAAARRR
jgi:hypothetical protein